MIEITPEMIEKVHVILIKNWDPIGISDIPEFFDEYDLYVPEVCQLIASESGEKEIFAYLWDIETNHIGLEGDMQHTRKVARKLAHLNSM